MELSTIQSNLISLVGTIASLAVGFGLFSQTTEQIVISSAGTLISLGFSLFTELRANTKVKAAIAVKDTATLERVVAGR